MSDELLTETKEVLEKIEKEEKELNRKLPGGDTLRTFLYELSLPA